MTKTGSKIKIFLAGVATVILLVLIGLIPLGFPDTKTTATCHNNGDNESCEYSGFAERMRHRLIEFIAGDELVLLNAQISPSKECHDDKVIMDIHHGLLDNTEFSNRIAPVCVLLSQRPRSEIEEANPPRIEFFKQLTQIK